MKESKFEYNFGPDVAGAIFLYNISSTNISFCNFTSNLLTFTESDINCSFGGAIYVLNSVPYSTFYLGHASFINNTATYGGAIHFLATKGTAYHIENTDFEENSASGAGGSIVIRNKNAHMSGNRFKQNKAYTGGAIILANGALTTLDNTGTNTDNSIFTTFNYFSQNSAAEGGSVAVIGSSI